MARHHYFPIRNSVELKASENNGVSPVYFLVVDFLQTDCVGQRSPVRRLQSSSLLCPLHATFQSFFCHEGLLDRRSRLLLPCLERYICNKLLLISSLAPDQFDATFFLKIGAFS